MVTSRTLESIRTRNFRLRYAVSLYRCSTLLIGLKLSICEDSQKAHDQRLLVAVPSYGDNLRGKQPAAFEKEKLTRLGTLMQILLVDEGHRGEDPIFYLDCMFEH